MIVILFSWNKYEKGIVEGSLYGTRDGKQLLWPKDVCKTRNLVRLLT